MAFNEATDEYVDEDSIYWLDGVKYCLPAIHTNEDGTNTISGVVPGCCITIDRSLWATSKGKRKLIELFDPYLLCEMPRLGDPRNHVFLITAWSDLQKLVTSGGE